MVNECTDDAFKLNLEVAELRYINSEEVFSFLRPMVYWYFQPYIPIMLVTHITLPHSLKIS